MRLNDSLIFQIVFLILLLTPLMFLIEPLLIFSVPSGIIECSDDIYFIFCGVLAVSDYFHYVTTDGALF